MQQKHLSKLSGQGVEILKFSPQDVEWHLKISQEAKWEELKEAASPASYSLLRDMLRK